MRAPVRRKHLEQIDRLTRDGKAILNAYMGGKDRVALAAAFRIGVLAEVRVLHEIGRAHV